MFEGDPKESGFSSHQSSVMFTIGDREVLSALLGAGVDYPTIFGLLWGWEMGHRGVTFPKGLTETVLSIEEHIQKKEEALDMQECRLHDIILDLLQVTYEKQVNDIVNVILKK